MLEKAEELVFAVRMLMPETMWVWVSVGNDHRLADLANLRGLQVDRSSIAQQFAP